MQQYVFLCKNKKPETFESGFHILCKKSLLIFTYAHNIPDSYKLFIRFFTEIICAKCYHYFIFHYLISQMYSINTTFPNKIAFIFYLFSSTILIDQKSDAK
jgi:hypothetical protein